MRLWWYLVAPEKPTKVSTSPDSTRVKVHRLCHLVLSQHIATDVSSHSTADSRDTLHLTRHHPIHVQNFTIRSHSTVQVPCLRPCLNVWRRVHSTGNFRHGRSHLLHCQSVHRLFWCPPCQVDPGVPLSNSGPTYQFDPAFLSDNERRN